MNSRIIIVDDHEVLRQGLKLLLQAQPGLTVVGEASDGNTAVQLAGQLAPDIVIMDIRIPRLNGVDATRQILAHRPGTKVIALSAHADHQSMSEMLRVGAVGYVLKDSAFDELAAAIHAVLAGNVFLSPRVTGNVVKGYIGSEASVKSTAFSELSGREREVLQLTAEGRSAKEIAKTLYVSVKTIETHRRNIMAKIGVDSIAGMTRYAIREGICTP